MVPVGAGRRVALVCIYAVYRLRCGAQYAATGATPSQPNGGQANTQNYLYDLGLTGSSSNVPQSQEPTQLPIVHSQDLTFRYGKLTKCPLVPPHNSMNAS